MSTKGSSLDRILAAINSSKEPIVEASGSKNTNVASSSSSFNPVEFYLDINIEEGMKLLPLSFTKVFGSTLPTHVALKDPRENIIYLGVTKRGSYYYFNNGWKNLVRFYGVYGGVWVILSYYATGKFTIKVNNLHGAEVNYPILHRPVIGGPILQRKRKAPFVPLTYLSKTIVSPIPDYPYVDTHIKWLSFDEVIGTKLLLDKTFTANALPLEDCQVKIIDEEGAPWPCFFMHNVGDPLYSAIVGGWAEFCQHKRLIKGKCIKFGVKQFHSNVLYFIPYC